METYCKICEYVETKMCEYCTHKKKYYCDECYNDHIKHRHTEPQESQYCIRCECREFKTKICEYCTHRNKFYCDSCYDYHVIHQHLKQLCEILPINTDIYKCATQGFYCFNGKKSINLQNLFGIMNAIKILCENNINGVSFIGVMFKNIPYFEYVDVIKYLFTCMNSLCWLEELHLNNCDINNDGMTYLKLFLSKCNVSYLEIIHNNNITKQQFINWINDIIKMVRNVNYDILPPIFWLQLKKLSCGTQPKKNFSFRDYPYLQLIFYNNKVDISELETFKQYGIITHHPDF